MSRCVHCITSAFTLLDKNEKPFMINSWLDVGCMLEIEPGLEQLSEIHCMDLVDISQLYCHQQWFS